jgi:hypothetical protein
MFYLPVFFLVVKVKFYHSVMSYVHYWNMFYTSFLHCLWKVYGTVLIQNCGIVCLHMFQV